METSFSLAFSRVLQRRDQRRIAERLGVSESTVSGWKKGRHVPEVETAVEIERILGLKPGELTVHLGFLPLEAGEVTITTPESAVIADDTLTGRDKRLVLDLLARIRDEK